MANHDMERALAGSKSYVSAAVITFVAYIFFWLPGLIFNIMYINDARRTQEIAGHSLPGVGCLWALLIINLLGLVLLMLFFCGTVRVNGS